jgi:acetyl/propionyl-CoA carboxylase alpha subunit
MIIKIIAHGVDRTEAIRRMRRALNECVVEGIATTMPFHLAVLDDPAFQRGETHTGFIPEMIERAQARAAEEAAAEASTAAAGEGTEPELEAEAVAGSGEPAA